MSNQSSGSSGLSSARARARNHGVPKMCWCGVPVVEFTSKTNTNPYRRFYRCAFAAAEKLKIDEEHVFKWVDEALLNEIESVNDKVKRLEEDVNAMKEIITESLDNEKKMLEKIEIELEERVMERMEMSMLDAKSSLRKSMCLVVVIGCIIIIGFSKLVGM